MSSAGKTLRLGSLFKDDGRTVVVAIDHGLLGNSTIEGISSIGTAIQSVLKGQPDAILISPGVLKSCQSQISGQVGVILSIPNESFHVEGALRLGADCVKTTYFGPVPLPDRQIATFASIARSCDEWGIPYLGEVVPMNTENRELIYDTKTVMTGTRQMAEIGADIVKTNFTGTIESFKEVIEACPVPVVIMGGAKTNQMSDVLKLTEDAIAAGASGIAFGRNVWQNQDPESMTSKLRDIVHAEASKAIEITRSVK